MAINYIKLSIGSTCDIADIYYQSGMIQTVYLDADLSKPEYVEEVEEEIEEDGTTIQTYQKLSKRYKFQVLVPEYLVDALKLLPMHNQVSMAYTNGLISMSMKNIKVEADFEDDWNGCMAMVTISFEGDNVIVKSGCCVNIS